MAHPLYILSRVECGEESAVAHAPRPTLYKGAAQPLHKESPVCRPST